MRLVNLFHIAEEPKLVKYYWSNQQILIKMSPTAIWTWAAWSSWSAVIVALWRQNRTTVSWSPEVSRLRKAKAIAHVLAGQVLYRHVHSDTLRSGRIFYSSTERWASVSFRCCARTKTGSGRSHVTSKSPIQSHVQHIKSRKTKFC